MKEVVIVANKVYYDKLKKLLKEHCAEKYEDAINRRLYSPFYSSKEYFQGRADSYTEIVGFFIGCDLMIGIKEDKELSKEFEQVVLRKGEIK